MRVWRGAWRLMGSTSCAHSCGPRPTRAPASWRGRWQVRPVVIGMGGRLIGERGAALHSVSFPVAWVMGCRGGREEGRRAAGAGPGLHSIARRQQSGLVLLLDRHGRVAFVAAGGNVPHMALCVQVSPLRLKTKCGLCAPPSLACHTVTWSQVPCMPCFTRPCLATQPLHGSRPPWVVRNFRCVLGASRVKLCCYYG